MSHVVEPVGPAWRKSSRCDIGQCVEVALWGGDVAVRDNTRPEIHLTFDGASWESLLRALRTSTL